jgi:hypothetical protein
MRTPTYDRLEDPDWLTPEEAAKILREPVTMIHLWLRRGELPCYIRRTDLDAALAAWGTYEP